MNFEIKAHWKALPEVNRQFSEIQGPWIQILNHEHLSGWSLGHSEYRRQISSKPAHSLLRYAAKSQLILDLLIVNNPQMIPRIATTI